MNRRLPIYRKYNPLEENQEHLINFFKNEKIEVLKIDLNE